MNLPETSPTLMRAARRLDADAWSKLVSIYGPFLYTRLRHKGLSEDDASDVVQDTMCAVSQSLPDFDADDSAQSFRGWIWVVARNKMLDHLKRRCNRTQAAGGSDAHLSMLEIPEHDDASDSETDPMHAMLVHRIKDVVREEFQPKTFRAFIMTTEQEKHPGDVADELGMTLGAVYKAKSRVLARLRQLLEDPFS